jgi:hypothetical protein
MSLQVSDPYHNMDGNLKTSGKESPEVFIFFGET